jgi:hypothetical protein
MDLDLARAARNLQERFEILGVSGKIIPRSNWDALTEDVHRLIPVWLPTLLSAYSIAGVWLRFDFRASTHDWDLLTFIWPEEYGAFFSDDCPVRDLIGYGFFPFARNEVNGSLWVTTIAGGPSSSVYFLDHSGWNGSVPTKENGLIVAHSSLAALIASLTIAE